MLLQSGKFTLKSDHASETKNKELSTFTQVYFDTPFQEGTRPIVLASVMTFNGNNTPGLRIADITHKGFKARFNEIVTTKAGMPAGALSDGTHVKEDVGYLAISQ